MQTKPFGPDCWVDLVGGGTDWGGLGWGWTRLREDLVGGGHGLGRTWLLGGHAWGKTWLGVDMVAGWTWLWGHGWGDMVGVDMVAG